MPDAYNYLLLARNPNKNVLQQLQRGEVDIETLSGMLVETQDVEGCLDSTLTQRAMIDAPVITPGNGHESEVSRLIPSDTDQKTVLSRL